MLYSFTKANYFDNSEESIMQMILNQVLTRYQPIFEANWQSALNELHTAQVQLTSGSRLRPQLTLLGYLASLSPKCWETDDLSLAAQVAVSIELIHKASLLLDDWIDGDMQRHGLPAFHAETTPEQAVLLAVKMVGLSTYRLRGVFPSDVIMPHSYFLCMDTLIDTIYSMASGAYKELTIGPADLYNFESVREIAKLETAEIIGNSILMGFYSNMGNRRFPEAEAQFKKIGDKCGYIFQAMNDLEVFSKPKALHEHKGHLNFDISTRRKSLTISLLYQIASKQDRAKLEGADRTELCALSQKYQIVKYYMHELEKEYASLLEDAVALASMGISSEWCSLFQAFLEIIKKTAEDRL